MVSGQPAIGWLIRSHGVRAAWDWLYDYLPGFIRKQHWCPLVGVPIKPSIQAEHCNREKCHLMGRLKAYFHSIGRPVRLGPVVQDECVIFFKISTRVTAWNCPGKRGNLWKNRIASWLSFDFLLGKQRLSFLETNFGTKVNQDCLSAGSVWSEKEPRIQGPMRTWRPMWGLWGREPTLLVWYLCKVMK